MAPSTEEGQALGTGRLVASGAAEGGRLLRRLVLGPGLRLFGWFLFSGGGPKPIPSSHGAFPAFAQQTQASYLGGGAPKPLAGLNKPLPAFRLQGLLWFGYRLPLPALCSNWLFCLAGFTEMLDLFGGFLPSYSD